MSNEMAALARIDTEVGPTALMRRATDAAGVCKEIVLRTAQNIQGKKYVKVEGWQAIANTFGCVASARDVENVPGGIRAIGEVRRMSDGVVLVTAEGFVGSDELTWEKRPMFARRAMAQTRAISRACRSAFAFVVVLMDANLSTTPAEEMDGIFEAEKAAAPAGAGTAALKSKVQAIAGPSRAKTQGEPPPVSDDDAPWGAGIPKPSPPSAQSDFVVDPPMTYGLGKGKPLAELSEKSLAWYEKTLAENIANPEKAQYEEGDKRALAAIKREQARRR